MSVVADRSTSPALPLAGSKARSATSPIRATVPCIATPTSSRSSSASVGPRRASDERAAGHRGRSQGESREEPLFPDVAGLHARNDASPMRFARPIKSRLDPGRPLLWVRTEEHVPFLETTGTGHGGIQEAKVPERRTAPVEVHDSRREILHVPKNNPHGHVPAHRPRREPRPQKEPHAASGSYKMPQSFALDEISLATSQHDLHREDVL